MSYDCECVGAGVATDISPGHAMLKRQHNGTVADFYVLARKDCPDCNGTGYRTGPPRDQIAGLLTVELEVERLRAAIREHRDQKGDDRCYLDDDVLYAVLPEGTAGVDKRLPPRPEFLESCRRSCSHYWDRRQSPEDRARVEAGDRPGTGLTIRELEDLVAEKDAGLVGIREAVRELEGLVAERQAELLDVLTRADRRCDALTGRLDLATAARDRFRVEAERLADELRDVAMHALSGSRTPTPEEATP